jgi:mRNA interferase RelE/StbE
LRTYSLAFLPSALKEWNKLDATLRKQFKKKLAERLETPRVVADHLHGLKDHYKIKLRTSGYRLVYEVDDDILRVLVIAVGKRDKGIVYSKAQKRKPE